MELHEKISQVREAKKTSRAEMATALNMSSQSYWNVETGKTELTVSRLTQIAEILGVPLGDLLDIADPTDKEVITQLLKRIKEVENTLKIYQDRLDSMKAVASSRLKELALIYFAFRDMSQPDLEKPTPFPSSIYEITVQNDFWHSTEEAITMGKLGLIDDETIKQHYQQSMLEWTPLTAEEIREKSKGAYPTRKSSDFDNDTDLPF